MIRIITSSDRACATNFLIVQAPDRIVGVEAAPKQIQLLVCEEGCLVPTNHFVDPASAGIEEPPNPRRQYSYNRRSRMRKLLISKQRLTIEDTQRFLQDHSDYPSRSAATKIRTARPPSNTKP